MKNSTDGRWWIRSDPTYLARTDTLCALGEFRLSGGFNARSRAQFSLALSLWAGSESSTDCRLWYLFTIHYSLFMFRTKSE